jgi:hypothetical protein
MSNFERLAGDRWPNAQIHGLGRYALRSERGEVFLYQTEAQARASAPFHNSIVFDLQPTPLPRKCTEIGYRDRHDS